MRRKWQKKLDSLNLSPIAGSPGSKPHGEGSRPACATDCDERCTDFLARWHKQVNAADALPQSGLSVEQRQVLQHRKAMVTTANERLQLLQDAMIVLQDDIDASRQAVVSINEAVFKHAAVFFRSAMSAALPSFDFQLESVGGSAVDGVRIKFCKAVDGSDGGSCDSRWSYNLGELSGGQRSLCSLAYLLGSSTAGIPPSVMLVDEVDAALDDANQTRIGELLQQCSRQYSCQVWAVSHSAIFHGWCSSFVKVTRTESGTAAEVVQQGSTFAGKSKAPDAAMKRSLTAGLSGGRPQKANKCR